MKYIKILGKNLGKFGLVNDGDFDYIDSFKWYINSNGYLSNGKIYMHQLIMPSKDNLEIEHKDRNKINNQRNNLRYATRSQNHANRGTKPKNSSSQYKGVSFRKDQRRTKPWRVLVCKNYKQYRCGNYETEKEAAFVYNKKAKELFGEFARLNNVI